MSRIFLAENQRHDHPDPDSEYQGKKKSGKSQISADQSTGVYECENIGGWRKEQKGDRRADSRAFFINPGKQRDNRAGTHGKQ